MRSSGSVETIKASLAARLLVPGTPEFEFEIAAVDRARLTDLGNELTLAIYRAVAHPRRLLTSVDDARRVVLEPLRRRGGGTMTLGAASLIGSGFVREAAVRALAEVHTGDELRFLLIRRNDWVAPVRRAAAEALDARAVASNAARFLAELALVERLADCGRDDHRAFVARVRRLLREDEATRLALVGRLGDATTSTRRAALHTLTDGVEPWPRDVLRAARSSPDGSLRVAALRAPVAASDVDAAVAAALRDPLGPVVAQALYLADERLPFERWETDLSRAFTDRRATVRAAARWIFGKRGVSDFADRYRRALADDDATTRVGAIEGLGETGDASDAPRIAAFLDDPRPRVRCAVVVAWARLADSTACDVLVRALSDFSRGVSRTARRALVGRRSPAALGPCAALVRDGRDEHVRINALHVVAAGAWWSAGPTLLAACASEVDGLSALARNLVHAWASRSSVPTVAGDVVEAMRAVLISVEARVDARDVRRVRWILDTQSR